jgi:4-hydroxy-tetrahydrodipicolinate synthase
MEIRGLFPATVTPFSEDGAIDYDQLQQHIQRVGSVPNVAGLVVIGNAGEITTLTTEERRSVIKECREAIPDGRILVSGIQGYPGPMLVEQAQIAADAGADAVLVCNPFDPQHLRALSKEPDTVYEVFSQLDREVGIPMIVFQVPPWWGCSYSIEALDRLADIPSVQAIKAGAGKIELYVQLYDRLHERISVLASADSPLLLPMLLYGAAGALIGVGAVAPEIWAELLQYAEAGPAEAAISLFNQRCVPLTTATHDNHMDRSVISSCGATKEALYQLGELRTTTIRAPAIPPDAARKNTISECLRRAGLRPAASQETALAQNAGQG